MKDWKAWGIKRRVFPDKNYNAIWHNLKTIRLGSGQAKELDYPEFYDVGINTLCNLGCPFCYVDDTRVIDSRPADDGCSIRRRRQCDACGRRFTTYEKVETIPLIVIKKDKNRETYDRKKIESGIIRSCHKRPVSAEQISKCIDDIENEIFNLEAKEVESTTIGEIVMDKIKDLDQVAYVRFASVYREFKDVNTFMNELSKLLSANSDKK